MDIKFKIIINFNFTYLYYLLFIYIYFLNKIGNIQLLINVLNFLIINTFHTWKYYIICRQQ